MVTPLTGGEVVFWSGAEDEDRIPTVRSRAHRAPIERDMRLFLEFVDDVAGGRTTTSLGRGWRVGQSEEPLGES
jgi:hypothetical protein